MTHFVVLLFFVSSIHLTCAVPSLHLDADPRQIIPGLTPNLRVTCRPGSAASDYRQIYIIQILSNIGDTLKPIVTLQPDQTPEIGVNNLRLTAAGQLGAGVRPQNTSLIVDIDTPLAGGTIFCKIVGLGQNGNEVTYTESIHITEHPESSTVHDVLKEMVLKLRREAEYLNTQTTLLQQENQRFSLLTDAKRTALVQKKVTLQQLQTQVESSRRAVEAQENHLNETASLLVQEIANVSAHAPPMRVAFNAVEKTERTYASGAQVLLETVELNEGSGYNSTTSVFHAPVAGVYYFTSAQLAHDTTSAAYRSYSIRRNATIMSSAFNGDDRQSSTFQHSSTGVVMSLTPYDTVTVIEQYSTTATTQLAAYGATPNGISTNFAGYILY